MFLSARFAPITHPVGDAYTSPKLKPLGANPAAGRTPQRQATMSERITARLKEFRLNASVAPPPPAKPEVHFDADEEEKNTPKVDKGKGKEKESGELSESDEGSEDSGDTEIVVDPKDSDNQ